MRADTLNIYRSVHTWTGILTGMLLFIAFYAGGISLFKEPLADWATPPAASETRARTVPLADAKPLITATIADNPAAARSFWLDLAPAEDGPVDRLRWDVRPEGAGEHDNMSTRHFVATLNDDGSAHAEEVERSKVGEFVNVLHMAVGLPADTEASRIFMGIVAAVYFVSLISGLLLFLPRLARDLFALRIDHKLRRVWRDAHVAVGLASLPFHLAIAVTATTFAFHDVVYDIQDQVVHGGRLGEMFRGAPPNKDAPPPDPAAMLPPDALVSQVTDLAPGFEPYALEYVASTTPRAAVRVWGRDPRGFEPRTPGGFAVIDPYTGEIVTTEYLPGHQSLGATVLAGLFAAHFGSYGGTLIKVLYFVLALMGAWLFFTGNLLWLEARRKRISRRRPDEVPEQEPAARRVAALSVGVCLGSVCGISLTIASVKWLHAAGLAPGDWHHAVYYGTFFAAIGWAQLRGAARSVVDLLAAAALASLAIPATSALAAGIPALGMWAHTPGVDAVALAGGLGLAGAALWARRRVWSSTPDSVWSAVSQGRAAS